MTDFIPVNTPDLSGNEKKYLCECIDSGWISSEGPFVQKFEKEFSRYVGRDFGIAVCNGSAAIELAIAMLDLSPGGEIIVPAFTIISCGNAIVRAGFTPVLVDSDPNTFNMRADDIAKKITKKTTAIMVVHIYGLPCEMEPIIALAEEHNLRIIEDAAEMHGQEYNGRKCGSFGDVSTFSFYPNKHITTGEGGMVVTDDPEMADRARSFRNLCFGSANRYEHGELGWNFRMTNLQAAVGLAQLERIDLAISRKREIGKFYQNEFKNIPEVSLPIDSTAYANNIYWVFTLLLKGERLRALPDILQKLGGLGVGTRRFFKPLHQQPVYKKMGLFIGEEYPVAELLSDAGFYIPCGLGITNIELEAVASRVRSVLN
jgi:perosamine synthetase